MPESPNAPEWLDLRDMKVPNQDADWDDLRPNGRVVYYEGDDPDGFAAEMLELGIDVHSPCPWEPWDPTGELKPAGSQFGKPSFDLDPFGRTYMFFIPPGRVEEIYGSERWLLGS